MITQNTHQAPRAAGDLDRGFGDNGTKILEGDEVNAIALLEAAGAHQGKIIGVLRDGNDFKLFRLEKDGTLDTLFGTNGYLRWGFASSQVTSIPTGITELGADKLLVTGYVREGSSLNYPAVARFNASGSIDPTFGESGVFVFKEPLPAAPSPSSPEHITDVANLVVIEAHADRILFSFNSRTLAPYRDHGVLIQLTAAGQLDSRFNRLGYVFFQRESQNTSCSGLAIRNNGNILVAGVSADRGFLAEFTGTGQINLQFGVSGFVVFEPAAGPLTLSTLLLQPNDDKPVVIGWFTTGSTRKGYVLRTCPDGKQDNSFNNGKALTIEMPFQSLQLNSAKLDSEQAIVVAGELNTRGLSLLGRVTSDGLRDPAFGNAGLSDPFAPDTSNYTTCTEVQTDRQAPVPKPSNAAGHPVKTLHSATDRSVARAP